MREIIDRRVLGAVRFIDISTNARIARPLRLKAERLTFFQNRRGDYVVVRAEQPDLLTHLDSFQKPPAEPASQIAFTAEVRDPLGEFLPRSFSLKLPRDPDPAHAGSPDSLFRAHEVALLSSPGRPVAANWCALRVAVENEATHEPIGRAAVRVSWGEPEESLLGMTDEGGEALLAVSGLPFHTISKDPNSEEELILTEVDARLEAFAVGGGGAAWPELVAAQDASLVKSAPVSLKIAPGRSLSRRIPVTIPNA